MTEATDFLSLSTQAGEFISLMLVIGSYAIAILLAVKARSTRSFQFEMFVWVQVLLFSEVPRIAETIGLINLSSIADAGLIVHTVSMVFLAGFVGIRTYKFFKG